MGMTPLKSIPNTSKISTSKIGCRDISFLLVILLILWHLSNARTNVLASLKMMGQKKTDWNTLAFVFEDDACPP
jgi:hypothetical protein